MHIRLLNNGKIIATSCLLASSVLLTACNAAQEIKSEAASGIVNPIVADVKTNAVHVTSKIEHWQTSQGSRVYFVRTEGLPMADIQVVFNAGSANDGHQFGIAELTAGMLDTGAGKWNADEIAQRFESVGAQFGVSSSMDMSTLSLRTLT